MSFNRTLLSPITNSSIENAENAWQQLGELLVRWKDGIATHVALKNLKTIVPRAATCLVWNSSTFGRAKKSVRLCVVVGSPHIAIAVRTCRFGIKILPQRAAEACIINPENNNTIWWDAIVKEIKSVRPAFEVWEKSYWWNSYWLSTADQVPSDLQCQDGVENFRRKARFVASRHRPIKWASHYFEGTERSKCCRARA